MKKKLLLILLLSAVAVVIAQVRITGRFQATGTVTLDSTYTPPPPPSSIGLMWSPIDGVPIHQSVANSTITIVQ